MSELVEGRALAMSLRKIDFCMAGAGARSGAACKMHFTSVSTKALVEGKRKIYQRATLRNLAKEQNQLAQTTSPTVFFLFFYDFHHRKSHVNQSKQESSVVVLIWMNSQHFFLFHFVFFFIAHGLTILDHRRICLYLVTVVMLAFVETSAEEPFD